jgi:hypothetical protein
MTNTTFNFSLKEAAEVELAIYDMFGRHMMAVANDRYEQGSHEIELQTRNLPSGHYILHFRPTVGESRAMLIKL